MTRSSEVAAAWDSAVWNHPTVLSWTSKIFAYEFSIEAEEDADIYFEQRVNFFTCKVFRVPRDHTLGGRGYLHTVEVYYALQDVESYATVRDRLEELEELVWEELGTDWNGLVGIVFEPELLEIEEVKVDDRRCWRGGWRFTAESY